ncbi:glycosyltransferase family 4 protein [Aureibaculum algae]|uniref:Glycosyltransferase family 4 protein n=1 Tax=Aureibaculum algae TaxID=2584122 RepID=A0A5B7TV48_9FLAO|nr:glycosyltransferase family 4 protein [Aureibaculum algae]QCX39144.1 glycosyltransferase family 4 protein [Aureibaculum algae]
MKIVLVTPLLDLGGGQRYITSLANRWSSQGYVVNIIVLRKGKSFYPINSEVVVTELNLTGEGGIKKAFSALRTLLKLRKKIQSINPFFVLSILSSTNILTILATRYLKTRVIVEDVMSPLRPRSKVENQCRKFFYKKADGIIALTDIAKGIIQDETGCKNIITIPNPVFDLKINESIKKEKIVLNVGRLNCAKGQKYFIEACKKINRPDWKFVILGDGELRKELEQQINNLDIHNLVTLNGVEKDVGKWLSKSTIFAFPSVSECFPIALLEGMAAGLPCVSFDCLTGPSELIEDGENGFLVPVGDVDQFSKKIVQLMNDENLRNKFSIKAKEIQQKFSIDKISNEILEFCSY